MTRHACVDCAALPEAAQPRRPRPAAHGGPRSRRCASHERVHATAKKERLRVARRVGKFGLTADEQMGLWVYQGRACPCGRKGGSTPPPGVHLDHDHARAREHGHPEDQGCTECVTGFLCLQCNRDIVGRLTRHWSRERVAAALHRLAEHLDDPPWQQLLRAREEGRAA